MISPKRNPSYRRVAFIIGQNDNSQEKATIPIMHF
jgi:hypothetical protein